MTKDRDRLTRRAALRLILSGAGMTILAACGSTPPTGISSTAPAAGTVPAPTERSASTSNTGATAGSASAAAQPKTGGTLRVVVSGDIIGLEPHVNVTNSPGLD